MAGGGKKEDEDARLWQAVAKSVRPLKDRNHMARRAALSAHEDENRTVPARKTGGARTAAGTVADGRIDRLRDALSDLAMGGIGANAKPDAGTSPKKPELEHGRAPGLDRRTSERLRRGKLPIEATIDLHGMSRDDAHRALTAFITAHRLGGKRCVRVVTGKGRGILKDAVPEWLNNAPLRGHILGFSYARRDDGGSGALYVLLKRYREG